MSDLLHRRYQMKRELGQGGMSVVYLAFDERLKREVALKVLHPHLATREDSRRRFLQEATAIARLEHPHILKIYDYASPEEERSYIVSQRIKGVTLKQWMDEQPPLPCEVVSLLALPIFEALAHAHDHNIIHRDVKPENIMIQEEDGAPILMDFGIAHLVDAETLTATGAVIGSPAHMAPEVVNGEPLTASADLFSMGTVLYWMCCGSLPFVAPNPAALFRRILEARFDPLLERRPDTFAPFARLIERCMKREPVARPKNALEIATELYQQLADIGLADYQHELRSLSEDQALYIENLPQRLAPRYLACAKVLKAEGDGAAALERLNRAIALNPTLEEAHHLREELLSTIPNQTSWWTLSLVVGLILGGLGWHMLPSSELQSVEARETSSSTEIKDSSTKKDQGENLLLNQDLRSRLPSETTSSFATSEQSSSSQESLQPQVRDVESGTGSLSNSTAQKKIKTLKERTKRVLQIPSKKKRKNLMKGKVDQNANTSMMTSESLSHETNLYQTLSIRSRYKGVSVWLDGKRIGRIFEIERSEGLKLSLKQNHQVIFRSPYCEEQRESLRFDQKQAASTKLVFECLFKPSSFKIKGLQGAEIYLRGDVPLRLGTTNQDISYKMTQASQNLSLLIVSKGQTDQPLSIKLTAGKHTEVKLP